MIKKINNYYEIQTRDYNWTPIKLNSLDNDKNNFTVLKDNKNLQIEDGNFREISISQVHLDRMNFNNNCSNDIFVIPIYFILGSNLLQLTSAYFGYIVFHKDEITEIQKNYNEVHLKLIEEFKTNSDIIYDRDKTIKNQLNSILTINELFEKLENYNITFNNKDQIISG